MKKANMIIGSLIFIISISSFNAQTQCKVLKPEISGSYVGECKKGLADGLGEATGTDFYKGEFVKGWPEGKGTYLWTNGATYQGEWKKGMRDGIGTYLYKKNEIQKMPDIQMDDANELRINPAKLIIDRYCRRGYQRARSPTIR